MGTPTVGDQCTTFGPNLTDPIITLPPNRLSTWRPPANRSPNYDNFTVGEIWNDPTNDPLIPIADGVAPLKIKDLVCPTWGLGKSTSANGTVITTIGPPWLPLIIPPMEIFSLDSKWSSVCTNLYSLQILLATFALFDPPMALTPAAVLLPTPIVRSTRAPALAPADTTTVSQRDTPSAKAAEPASLPNDPAASPAKTEDPGRDGPTQSPAIASADPADSNVLPVSPADSPKNKDGPASAPLSDSPLDSPSDSPSDLLSGPKVPSASGNPSSSSAPDPPSGDAPKSHTGSKVSIAPESPQESPQGESPYKQTQGLGAFIYSAFGLPGPEIDGSPTISLSLQSIFTIGAQTFAANPTGFKVNDASISPGGAAQEVDGTPISLGQSAVMVIRSSTISLTDPISTPVLTVAGQTFIPNPSAFPIAGTIISAGGHAVTVGGTTISLDQSGALAIGSSTISLIDPSSTPFATKAVTLGEAHTAQRIPNGGLVVASQTFAPGVQATIAGVEVSVDSGKAIVDGITHNLAPIAPTPLSIIADEATTAVQPGIAGASEAPVINIGGQAMTLSQASPKINIAGQTVTPGVPYQGSPFVIAGQTLTPGGAAITVSGIPISLPASQILAANLPAMAIEASTVQEGGSASGAIPVTVGNQVLTPNPSAFAIAGTTISAGGPGLTVAGTVISLQPSGKGLVVGSSTLALAASAASPGVPTAITLGDQVFTPNPSAFAIAGTTISAGGPGVTIAGTLISLQPSGAGLVVGSSTITLPSQSNTPNAVTIGNQVFTPNPTGFSIAGTTLSAGAPGVTVDGTVVSLEASGMGLVLGSSTIELQGTGSSVGSANANLSSGAASTISSSVAGDMTSISSAGSVGSTPSGGSTIPSSQPTQVVASGGHTHSTPGRAGVLALFVASIVALFISASM